MSAKAEPQRQLVRFRGRSYVAFVFSPVVPIVGWLEELDATLTRSPGFFAGRPVVLDLSAVELSRIRHCPPDLQPAGPQYPRARRRRRGRGQLGSGLPPLLTGGRQCSFEDSEAKRPKTRRTRPRCCSRAPVRSGQSIVFTEGDVTVLGSVGSGAEIVAGGSIHVYGTLRGRAMAGVNGNSAARIYCQKIEAELLAIDGYYQTAEQIDDTLRNRPAQAWLDGETMKITALN